MSVDKIARGLALRAKSGRWQSGVAQPAHTGTTTADVTQLAIVIPGGTIGPNGRVEIMDEWSVVGPINANTKTVRIRFGGTTVHSMSLANNLAGRQLAIITNRGAENSQIVSLQGAQPGFGVTATAQITPAIDTSADVTILFQATLANGADSMTLESYIVKVFPA
jgi:hypothetical protein